jgi:general secretion pathway protein J
MSKDAGFTLLEMMVALVVFGLVMAGVAQTFEFGLAAWREGPLRTAESENLAALDAALTRIVGHSVPGTLLGNGDKLALTTILPSGSRMNGAFADVVILVRDGKLIMRYRQHPAGIPLGPLPAPATETLAYGIKRLEMTYLIHRTGSLSTWSPKWQGNDELLLVRLHLELVDGREWPDLVMAPGP